MYDYVVVGAGSAGCVLAARLSENPHVRVAIIEAGGRDAHPAVRIPLAAPLLLGGRYDWAETTLPQEGLGRRSIRISRGRALGGSSSLNGQMWLRGHREDYDTWARTTHPGWGFENVLPFFQRAEHRKGSNHQGIYGRTGPLHVRELEDTSPLTEAFLRACLAQGHQELCEANAPDNTGFAHTSVNHLRGRRFSSADAYLRPALRRPNLVLFRRTHAQRIVLDRGRAQGVEVRTARGTNRVLSARREIVLATGAIGSPKLLMLSGIGDHQALRSARVEPTVHLPGVGKNLLDHLFVTLVHHCPSPTTLSSAAGLRSAVRYLTCRKGSWTSNGAEGVLFARSRPGLTAPDLEICFCPGPLTGDLHLSREHGITLAVALLQPASRGEVRLAGPDPNRPPHIDPRYLTDEAGADIALLRRGSEIARELLADSELAPFAGRPWGALANATDEPKLSEAIRETATTMFHHVGTCRMGTDQEAVVDPELRVHGVVGLRIADASVMPTIPRGHPHAATTMIAERAASLLQGEQ